jgi:hypothetical protein
MERARIAQSLMEMRRMSFAVPDADVLEAPVRRSRQPGPLMD